MRKLRSLVKEVVIIVGMGEVHGKLINYCVYDARKAAWFPFEFSWSRR